VQSNVSANETRLGLFFYFLEFTVSDGLFIYDSYSACVYLFNIPLYVNEPGML